MAGATALGLQLAASVLRGKYASRSSLVRANSKDNLADLIMSLATVIEMGGSKDLILAAASISHASPSRGGGLDSALTALRNGRVFEVAAYVKGQLHENTKTVVDDNNPGDLSQESSSTDPTSEETDGSKTVEPGKACGDSEPTTPVAQLQTASDNPDSLTQPTIGASAPTAVCRRSWRRQPCTDPGCTLQHPTLCSKSSCTKGRAPGCVEGFHGDRPKARQGPSVARGGDRTGLQKGNGSRGSRRPPTKATAATRSGPPPAVTILRLRAEKAEAEARLAEAKLAKLSSTHKSYRDAVKGPSNPVPTVASDTAPTPRSGRQLAAPSPVAKDLAAIVAATVQALLDSGKLNC